MRSSFLEKTAKQFANKSPTRAGLRIGIYEGITALVIGQLLGGPYLTGYLIHLGAGSGQIGFALAIPTLANIFTVISALYIQRIQSRKRVLLHAASSFRILWVLTGFIPFLLPQQWWIGAYLAMFMTAYSINAFGSVAWSSLISDMVPARVRGRYFGIRNTIHWGIGCVAILAGGLLLEHFPGGTGFAILYGICALLTIINIWQIALYPDLPFEKSAESTSRALLLKPLKDKPYFKATLFLAVWIFMQNTVIPLFSYVMLHIMKLPYFPHVSVISTVQNLAMMCSFYLWGNLNAKWPTQKLLLWTLPVLGLACFAWLGVAVLPVFAALVIVHILLGIGMGGFSQLAFNFVIGDTPKADRPMYFAIYTALTGLTGFLGPTIGGQIYRLLQNAPVWAQEYGFNAGVGAILIIAAVFVAPRFLAGGKRSAIRVGRMRASSNESKSA